MRITVHCKQTRTKPKTEQPRKQPTFRVDKPLFFRDEQEQKLKCGVARHWSNCEKSKVNYYLTEQHYKGVLPVQARLCYCSIAIVIAIFVLILLTIGHILALHGPK